MNLTMRLYKRGKYWYAEFQRAHPKSLKCTDKETAEYLFRKLKKAFLAGRFPELITTETSPTLKAYIESYTATREISVAQRTWLNDRLALNRLLAVIGNRKLSLIGRGEIDTFVADCHSRGMKRVSINTFLRHLKAAFSQAVKMEIIKKSPFDGYSMLKEERRSTRYLPPATLHTIASLMEADGEIELITMLWFYVLTGARRTEIHNLEARDIHRDSGTIHIRKAKGGHERWAPISPVLDEIIGRLDLPRFGRIFRRYQHPDTITHKIKTYLVRAGYGDYRLHDLRHTAGSLLAISGATQRDIKDILGHTDIRTTDRYIHQGDERMKGVVVKLDEAVRRGDETFNR